MTNDAGVILNPATSMSASYTRFFLGALSLSFTHFLLVPKSKDMELQPMAVVRPKKALSEKIMCET